MKNITGDRFRLIQFLGGQNFQGVSRYRKCLLINIKKTKGLTTTQTLNPPYSVDSSLTSLSLADKKAEKKWTFH